MRVIKADNINHGFKQALALFLSRVPASSESRNGQVLRITEPVMTEYTTPMARVLQNPVRRPNPFFHFMEAMWMLAGRNDIKFVNLFNKRMAEYSDDGATQAAAYGYRWLNHFNDDQLKFVIDELIENPNSRRAVISMWDPEVDIPAVKSGGKDVPCNTTIYFIRRPDGFLDMTVANRSNDAIWGCYGANAVHMSILHEYVARWVGAPIGVYYQLSNDLHIYTDVFDRDSLLRMYDTQSPLYYTRPTPLIGPTGTLVDAEFEQMHYWDTELQAAMQAFNSNVNPAHVPFQTHWFKHVFTPMWNAWALYKRGCMAEAILQSREIKSCDWGPACTHWLETAKGGPRYQERDHASL